MCISEKIMLIGQKYCEYSSVYLYPFDSQKLNIFKINNLSTELNSYGIDDIICKCMMLQFKNEYLSFPIIHSLAAF